MNALETVKYYWRRCIHFVRKKPMLKSIVFTFTTPICACSKNNTGWGWGSSFYITCKTCNVTLSMPTENMKAAIVFEKPYPDGHADKDNILRIIK
jgi:hypothetical protein